MIKNETAVLPIYDEKVNLLIRIAIQDHSTNEGFIKTLSDILKKDNLFLK